MKLQRENSNKKEDK